jgi:hypothetical protein
MKQLIEALDLALEALEEPGLLWRSKKAITAIKQARSAPVQEPDHGDELTIAYMSGLHDGKKKRAWVGLTDDDKQHIEIMGGKSDVMLAEMVEAKLKEKNNG